MGEKNLFLTLKEGLKFSLGAAMLGLFFWHRSDVLDNYVYPIFGYVSVLVEPSAGGAIIAGLGRLGGSALGGFIAAVLVNSFGIYGSGFVIIGPITFILSALICETYRWQAAYSQATILGTLIAMQLVGTSGQQNIWIYLRSRLLDNWIGIAFGIAVALLFWRRDTRTDLNQNLKQVLQDIPRLFRAIIDDYMMPTSSISPVNTPALLLSRVTKTTQTSLTTLAKATNEFHSEALVEENWSGIVASQSQLSRQLSEMLALSSGTDEQRLACQFTAELNQLAQHFAQSCETLSVIANTRELSTLPTVSRLEHDLATIERKLDELRLTGKIAQYNLPEILRFFQFLHDLTGLIREFQLLQNRVIHKAEVATTLKRRSLVTLPKRTPLPLRRVLEIVGIGMAIGMAVAMIRHIEFPYPSAYEKIADTIVVGVIIMLVQPTRGRAIALGIAVTSSLVITILFIYLIVKSFGYNPVSSGVAYFFTYVSCALMGFTPVARVGAIVAGSVISKDIFPFFDQGIAAVLVSVPCSVFLGVLITTVFMGRSSSHDLEASLSESFKQMGQLYQTLLNNYLLDTIPKMDAAQLKQGISQTIAKHPMGLKFASMEQVSSALATKQKNLWSFLLSCEQKLLIQLGTLEAALQQPMPDPIREQFSAELQVIAQQTTNAFNQITALTTAQVIFQPPQLASLVQAIEAMEQRLLSLRVESRSYPLEELIAFSSAFLAMKAIASNLNRMSQDLSTYIQ